MIYRWLLDCELYMSLVGLSTWTLSSLGHHYIYNSQSLVYFVLHTQHCGLVNCIYFFICATHLGSFVIRIPLYMLQGYL